MKPVNRELVRSHRYMHTFGVMAVERIRVSWLLFEISKMVIIYAMDRSAHFTVCITSSQL